jgi:hypothetical protein
MGFRTVAIAPGKEKEKLARELALCDTLQWVACSYRIFSVTSKGVNPGGDESPAQGPSKGNSLNRFRCTIS